MTGRPFTIDVDNGNVDWMAQAACRNLDPTLMFPEKPHSQAMAREAKAVCATCPVVADCLEYALVNNERHGIWGNKSERELTRLRREMRARGELPAASSSSAGPLIHGNGYSAYRRCKLENGEACAVCKAGHAAEQLRRKEDRRSGANAVRVHLHTDRWSA